MNTLVQPLGTDPGTIWWSYHLKDYDPVSAPFDSYIFARCCENCKLRHGQCASFMEDCRQIRTGANASKRARSVTFLGARDLPQLFPNRTWAPMTIARASKQQEMKTPRSNGTEGFTLHSSKRRKTNIVDEKRLSSYCVLTIDTSLDLLTILSNHIYFFFRSRHSIISTHGDRQIAHKRGKKQEKPVARIAAATAPAHLPSKVRKVASKRKLLRLVTQIESFENVHMPLRLLSNIGNAL